MNREPTKAEYRLAVEALAGLVREDYPAEPLADLADTFCGTFNSDRATADQVAALAVVEAFIWPHSQPGDRR